MARYDCIAVYIMASKPNGTLYIGVTSDLIQRVCQHRESAIDGFTKKYECKTLVWFEQYEEMHAAIAREKDIKKWRRAWKLRLIEEANPQWRDLFEDFVNPHAAGASLALHSGLGLRPPRNDD
jgi:putative endonuclease